jgi:ribonuclease HI
LRANKDPIIIIMVLHRRLKDGGCAWVFFPKEDQVTYLQQTIRLSSDTSVFRSESIALLEASAFAAKHPGSTIIFTDSKSNLEALKNASLNNPEIAQLFNMLQ